MMNLELLSFASFYFNIQNHPLEHRYRLGSLREIVLARALLRCGDCNQLAKTIMQEYERDLRPLFYRHARACQ